MVKKLTKNEQVVYLANSNFINLDKYIRELDITNVGCVLFDLGMSSYQLDSSNRGFTFMKEEELDMRMDKGLGVRAMDLVNGLGVKELTILFKKLGEERFSKQIATEIVSRRKRKNLWIY